MTSQSSQKATPGCSNCGAHEPRGLERGRCRVCAAYWRAHGYERPPHLYQRFVNTNRVQRGATVVCDLKVDADDVAYLDELLRPRLSVCATNAGDTQLNEHDRLEWVESHRRAASLLARLHAMPISQPAQTDAVHEGGGQ